MPTVNDPIFCCIAAAPVPLPANHKPHHDPNRELHEKIFRSFIRFAIQRHQEVDRQEQSRIQTSQEFLHRLRFLVDSAPSTPLSFPSTPVSLSPAQFYNAPLPEVPELPQLGLASALQMPPKQPIPTPVLTYEELVNNPLNQDSRYVIHLTSRHDFGPVYSHRYFVYPVDMSDEWIEISKHQWFAHSIHFNMKAEKWDLKCLKDGRFFRMTLRPNLSLRGRFSVPTPTSTTSTIQRSSPRRTVTDQASYPMASCGMQFVEKENSVPVLMPSPDVEQYVQTSYPLTASGKEFVQREYSVPMFMPAQDAKQVSYIQSKYPTASGGAEFVERERSVPTFMPRDGKQVSYDQTTYPLASGGVELVEREPSFPMFMPTSAKQVSYAQVAQMTYPMASGGMKFVERECLASILMPTPDTKQVSYLVSDGDIENGLDRGAK